MAIDLFPFMWIFSFLYYQKDFYQLWQYESLKYGIGTAYPSGASGFIPLFHSLLPFLFSLTLFDTNCNIFSISTHRNLLTINVCNYPCIYTNKRTSFSPWSLQIVFMLLNPYNMSKNLDSHTIANTVLTLTEGERSST